MKAKDLCEITGISQSGLSKIENGNQSVTEENLISFKECLKVNLHWLLTGEGSMSPIEEESKSVENCRSCGQPLNMAFSIDANKNLIEEKNRLLDEKDRTIAGNEKLISSLEKESERLRIALEKYSDQKD